MGCSSAGSMYHGRLGRLVAEERTEQLPNNSFYHLDERQTDTDWRKFFKKVLKDETDTVSREGEKQQGSCFLTEEYLSRILSWPEKAAQIPWNHCSDNTWAGWTCYRYLQCAHLRGGCSSRDGMIEATMERRTHYEKKESCRQSWLQTADSTTVIPSVEKWGATKN